jgi:heme exporter protein A
VIRIRGLALGRGARTLLEDADAAIAPGERIALIGDNGSGKSTLLRIVAGLMAPLAGSLSWAGRSVRRGDPIWHACLLYQGHASGWKEAFGARENLLAQAALDLPGLARAERERRVDAALDRAGVARQRHLPFARLSAGQRRRIALARLALGARPLWLLDEPNTALDTQGQSLFAELLDAHLATGGCAIVATHLPVAASGPRAALRLQAPPETRPGARRGPSRPSRRQWPIRPPPCCRRLPHCGWPAGATSPWRCDRGLNSAWFWSSSCWS